MIKSTRLPNPAAIRSLKIRKRMQQSGPLAPRVDIAALRRRAEHAFRRMISSPRGEKYKYQRSNDLAATTPINSPLPQRSRGFGELIPAILAQRNDTNTASA